MKKGAFVIGILILFLGNLKAQENHKDAFRSLLNLANYLANDYENAVENGKVINDFEYKEMQEFAGNMQKLQAEIVSDLNQKDSLSLANLIDSLNKEIANKASNEVIKSNSNKISKLLLAQGIIENTPLQWPNISNGKKLYTANCAKCHGDNGLGDGISAESLLPKPTNFKEAAHLYPFHVFNTVRLGVEGTAMKPILLSDEETWDLAFYIMTIAYADTLWNKELYNDAIEKVSLVQVANEDNKTLAQYFSHNPEENVKALRFYNVGNLGYEQFDVTLNYLKVSIDLYKSGLPEKAIKNALDAYIIGFEPLEIKLGATQPKKVALIESEMMKFRALMQTAGNEKEIQAQYDVIAYQFDLIKNEKNESGFWFIFVAAFSILLREGLEALLIIVTILMVLQSYTKDKKPIVFVHGGWLLALFIGIVSFFFAKQLIAMGTQWRELIEGLGALLAVVVLLSVGYWLHSKSHAESWSKFIKEKLNKHLSANNLWPVAFLSFIVVFREAFESVIFLSTLSMSDENNGMAVFIGFIAAMVLLALVAVAILSYSKKIPIQQVFKISSIMMIVLAVILAGKGIKELQEAAYVPIHLLPITFKIDFLGLYSTYETILAQILTMGIAMILWFIGTKKPALA